MPITFARWKSPDPGFDSVLKAWSLSSDLHVFQPPAMKPFIEMVVRKVGRPLPKFLWDLYGWSNGLSLLAGNLNIDPVSAMGNKQSLDNHTDFLRQIGWKVPLELVVFGSGGSETPFGIWSPKKSKGEGPVIELAESFDESGNVAVLGTSFLNFLKARTACFLLTCSEELNVPALDALGLPQPLRRENPEESVLRDIYKWADPGLPEYLPDPNERGLEVEALRKMYGSD